MNRKTKDNYENILRHTAKLVDLLETLSKENDENSKGERCSETMKQWYEGKHVAYGLAAKWIKDTYVSRGLCHEELMGKAKPSPEAAGVE